MPQLISGTSPEAEQEAAALFGQIAPELVVLKPIEAEFAKLFTNAYRYIGFAVTNQFYLIAKSAGLDYNLILQAMKHDYPRAAIIPTPGFAAGPCLVKDTMQLLAFARNEFALGNAAHHGQRRAALAHYWRAAPTLRSQPDDDWPSRHGVQGRKRRSARFAQLQIQEGAGGHRSRRVDDRSVRHHRCGSRMCMPSSKVSSPCWPPTACSFRNLTTSSVCSTAAIRHDLSRASALLLVASLKHLLEMHGLEVFHARPIPSHGGSIRVYAARKGAHPVQASVSRCSTPSRAATR